MEHPVYNKLSTVSARHTKYQLVMTNSLHAYATEASLDCGHTFLISFGCSSSLSQHAWVFEVWRFPLNSCC
jgi:hypothetical protein